jgi:Zn-dependent M32 family carboxypeptidase
MFWSKTKNKNGDADSRKSGGKIKNVKLWLNKKKYASGVVKPTRELVVRHIVLAIVGKVAEPKQKRNSKISLPRNRPHLNGWGRF